MHRVYLPDGFAAGTRIAIPEEESHHLRVRRGESGEPLELLDGRGAIGEARLEAEGKQWHAIVERVSHRPEPAPVGLIVAAGDKDRFGWLIEKAVETGVTEVIPVETDRSRDVASRIRPQHLVKLERRASEALKQAGGGWIPRIAALIDLEVALGALGVGARWLADPAGGPAPPLGAIEPVTIAIGPEGGFTAVEKDRLAAAGFVPVSLGDRILRYETAAVAAAVVAGLRRKESA